MGRSGRYLSVVRDLENKQQKWHSRTERTKEKLLLLLLLAVEFSTLMNKELN
jgi:hypothetical protein